jgi:SAM-dependent methyltransferase
MEADVYRQFEQLERDHWWFRGRRRVYLGLIRLLLSGRSPARVLDLGCGVGGFQQGLRELGETVIASDVDQASLVHCRQRGFQDCVQSLSGTLPFASDSFDLVCMFDVLEHTADDHEVLVEVRRILRPGGLLVLTVPAYQFLYANNDRVAGHYRRYSRGELRGKLRAADFELVRATYSNVFLLPLILPAVLASKLLERLSGRGDTLKHSNLSWPAPPFVNELLYRVFAAELPFSRRFSWPAGHSLFAAARRPKDPEQAAKRSPPLA